jgi:carboxymethylenebutenolidase
MEDCRRRLTRGPEATHCGMFPPPPLSRVFRFTALVAVACPGLCAGAQDPALARLENSPRHHEWVALRNGDRAVHTFVAYPEKSIKATAVLVIHENRGLNDWARAVADRLAEEGFIALAPDLLSGAAPGGGNTKDFSTSGDATRAIGQLPPAQVVGDLGAVAAYARTIPAANGRLAVVGFCWGGSQTWRFAMAHSDLAGAFPFYGTAPDEAEGFARIGCTVHGFYGGNDARVNATLERTAAAMKAAGKTFDPVVYEGAGHAYMRSGEAVDAQPANKAAMDQSWVRLLALLRGL